jgi:integrase
VSLYKRNGRYWTQFRNDQGVRFRKPLIPAGKRQATTDWREATRLEKAIVEAAMNNKIDAKAGPTRLFEACDAFLNAKRATGDSDRNIAFLTERLKPIRDHFGDVRLTAITREMIEGYQAKRKLASKSNRTINMDVGALRQVLKRYRIWKRLESDVKFLTEHGGSDIGRALTGPQLQQLFTAAQSNTEWEHVYCAAVLAANTGMGKVEIKNLRRENIDLAKAEITIMKSKGGRAEKARRRQLSLNASALEVVQTMMQRSDTLGHTSHCAEGCNTEEHYLWCASKNNDYNPTQPAASWDNAWRSLRKEAGLTWLRFHDLRHTVATELLEDPSTPDSVVEAIMGHLSKRMLQHYSHIRMNAKKQALDRLDERRKAANAGPKELR